MGKYYAVEVDSHKRMKAMSEEEIEDMKKLHLKYKIVGDVCRKECTTDCVFMRKGNCPFFFEKDLFGEFIAVRRY